MLYVATARQATCERTHPLASNLVLQEVFKVAELQQLRHLQVRLGAAVGHAVLVRPHELLEAPLYTLPHQRVAAPQRRVLPAVGEALINRQESSARNLLAEAEYRLAASTCIAAPLL